MNATESDVAGPRGLVVGTAGHVDHGKTTLVGALTGVQTDRWREERERGLTIDIGFAPFDLAPDLETGVVDVPGHEDFLKNMLAGATGIDVLLLVIGADEGPMPQTREHLAIARLLDVSRGVVALTKRDRVDDEWLALAEEAARELLVEHGCADWPIVPVSSTTNQGLDDLLEALRTVAADAPSRRRDDLFRMPVDRAFTIHGTGTVVTGTVWSGAVRSGDTVRLLPGGATSRVRGLEVHGNSRADVSAGRRCALALVGVETSDASRGTVLVTHPGWEPVGRLGVRVEALSAPGRPIEHSQRIRVYIGTREAMARVVTEEGRPIEPGAAGWAVLVLEEPLVTRVGDRGIVRFYSPVTTIGGLRVAELDPPRAWARRTAGWTAILDGDEDEAFAAAVRLAGTAGFDRHSGAIHLGSAPKEVERAAARTGAILLGERWFSAESREETMSRVLQSVERLHAGDRRSAGVPLESVRSELVPAVAPELVEACLAAHVEAGTLETDGPRVSTPGATATLTATEEVQLAELRTALEAGGLQPPTVNDLGSALKIPRDVLDDLLRLLVDGGEAVSVTPEIYVPSGSVQRLVSRVEELLGDGTTGAPALFKEEFGLSRKYLIPLLEYLDRTGVTRRVPEGRVLAGRAEPA